MPPPSITTTTTKLFLLLLLLHGGHCLKSLDMAMEMEMDSEAHSRMLWESSSSNGRRYISYDALRSDVVPCSRQGVPYYNCRIMTTANPYTRGCETITRCRDVDP
ncbi:rapid alkalinization factor 23 [Oryza sativa Japonica Group]|jgi:hypothetical protein|uniref:Os11g0456000 protein n=8 Tax=Oryza TaxID=4527 RepID=B9GAK0_ORYSJ|nr:rapid alkalinization factor 23 [Oryza sativa Japonica Group]XP_052135494.1 rapid alkalinization factor 23-like [Oryza glaberrima]EEC68104.1 hypothetical protein OsI_36000 [Oryza sativa Indica Group]KAB8115190.1 hypothetical protein EE612_055382 [Oryza sativa]ABA93504.1 Rapid ALkalinization Factor family protein, expressed [Oryza sativa Japonica Group]ADZ40494.1 rapid alkalinizatoin factor [Oryza sativa Japonica Group]EEE52056.1 hypothetical protein OsJ_33806 [Oryza sativa Japonica Group]|eukprot:NP_001067847.1 Os11g0456000 [Oryza sativa Japonica Group]